MALKNKYMLKSNMLTATAALSLEAKVGESLLIKGLYWRSPLRRIRGAPH